MKDITFVKLGIPDKLLITYEDDIHHAEDWPNYLEGLLDQGYKVSLVSNPSSGSVGVTITDKREGSPNINKCFSQWAGSLGKSTQKAAVVLLIAGNGPWAQVAKVVKEENDKIEVYLEKLLREKIKQSGK